MCALPVLLTGAGFSRNWGGRIAREIWEDVFSRPSVQKRNSLRTLLLRENNFEDALAQVRAGGIFDRDDWNAIEGAVYSAFQRMDREHVDHLARAGICTEAVRAFLRRFRSLHDGTGYFFTVNQDVLVEQMFQPSNVPQDIKLPGVVFATNGDDPPREIQVSRGFPTPIVTPEPRLAGQLNYMKLHGCFMWRMADGSQNMIMGAGKDTMIAKSALLAWYHKKFEAVLCSGDVRLMTIGYSFKDEHINSVIRTAAESYGMRLFVWDTNDPLKVVLAAAGPQGSGRALAQSLMGAASRPMAEVFPNGIPPTAEYERIVTSFFES